MKPRFWLTGKSMPGCKGKISPGKYFSNLRWENKKTGLRKKQEQTPEIIKYP